MKKLLSVVLSFAMLFSVSVIPAVASETTALNEEKIYYFNDFSEGSAYLCDDTTEGVKTVLENELPDYIGVPAETISNSLAVSSDNLSVMKTSITKGNSACFWTFPTVTLADKPELVMEYKFRFTPGVYRTNNFMNSDYSDDISSKYGTSKAVNVDASKGEIYSDVTKEDVIASGMNLLDWTTVTIVYSNEKATRDIYINGEKKFTSEEGVYENQYFSTNKLRLMQFVQLDSTLTSFEMDYLKIYSLPESFEAKIAETEDAVLDEMEVTFNFIPKNLPKKENFSVSGNVKVSSVEKITDKTYKIIPEETLASGTEYTLSFTGIKDSVGRDVEIAPVTFKTMELSSYEEETVYYYNDFTSDFELPTQITSSVTGKPALSVSKDNCSVMTIDGFHATASSGYKFPTVIPEGKPELVVEYRLRMDLGSNGYFDSFINEASSDRHGNSKGVALGGVHNVSFNDYSKAVRFDISKDEAIENGYNFSDWNTVTLVYSNDEANPTRDIYVNGVYLGTSEAGKYENMYASTGKFTLAHSVFKYQESQEFELDYVKIYKKTENFTCKAENASSVSTNGMIVHFNETPAECSVTSDKFILSNGTKVNVEKIDESTFRLVTETSLSYNAGYILTVNGIKDIHGRELKNFKLWVKTKNDIPYTEEKIYYYNDFADGTAYLCDDTTEGVKTVLENELPDYIGVPAETIGNSLAVSSDNLSVMKTSITKGNSACFWTFPTVTLADKPELIMEYKFRFTPGVYRTTNYMKSDYTDDISMKYGSSKGINVDASKGEIYTDSTNAEVVASGMNLLDWTIISIVYSNEKATRDIYVNGVKMYTSKEGVYENQYFSTNKLRLMQFVQLDSTLTSFEMDYLKIYSTPESLEAKIENESSVDPESIKVTFNASVKNVSEKQISVNGILAKNVVKAEGKNNTYVFTPGRPVKGNTTHKLSINGVVADSGKILTDTYSFTTKPMDNITVTAAYGEGGNVLINKSSDKSISVEYATPITIEVDVLRGYNLVSVAVNGKLFKKNADGIYVTDELIRDASVEVVFELDTAIPEIDDAVSEAFVESLSTAYVYGNVTDNNLSYTLKEYGVLVSSDETALIYGNADCFKLEATNSYSEKTGKFGIKIIDSELKLGGNYYVLPYAVYEVENSDDYIAYGNDVININIWNK